jgi:hypothetical protein
MQLQSTAPRVESRNIHLWVSYILTQRLDPNKCQITTRSLTNPASWQRELISSGLSAKNSVSNIRSSISTTLKTCFHRDQVGISETICEVSRRVLGFEGIEECGNIRF